VVAHRLPQLLGRSGSPEPQHNGRSVLWRGGLERFDIEVVERRDGLRLIVFEHAELFAAQAFGGFAGAVGDLDINQDQVGIDADDALLRSGLGRPAGRRLLGFLRAPGEGQRDKQSEDGGAARHQ